MEEKKLCPLLREPCIEGRCKLWVDIRITVPNKQGGASEGALPADCAFVHAGTWAQLSTETTDWDKRVRDRAHAR